MLGWVYSLQVLAGLAGFLAGCAEQPITPVSKEIAERGYVPVAYQHIEGWAEDDVAEAGKAWLHSCRRFKWMPNDRLHGAGDFKAPVSVWKNICKRAFEIEKNGGGKEDWRFYFESEFQPLAAQGAGFLTGYYLPAVKGAHTKTAQFQVPVYKTPPGHTAGLVSFSRAEIDKGALAGKGLEIAWLADPVDLFFLQVQGSGVLELPDGSYEGLNFAARNGHEYVAIGKVLAEMGELEEGKITMQVIRNWLAENPARVQEILHQNPSYIFMKRIPMEEIKGAAGVPLTGERSLAVDDTKVPYGMPIFVQTTMPEADGTPEHGYDRLLIAQDTGSAIKGAERGDLFFGAGTRAEQYAGRMQQRAKWIYLVPREVLAYAGQ